MSDDAITFGPVPSRRLGQSLGINNIPPKSCPYSCIYCQVGRTPTRTIDLRAFFRPEEIIAAAARRVREIRQRGGRLDYLTFVADGEPTLDIHLGRAIELLRDLGVKIAVISNASLLWRQEVRESLRRADWVSLKVDTLREEEWRRVNRPHPSLHLETVLRGMLDFSSSFEGRLVTETMLVAGVNDGEESIAKTRNFLEALRPSTSYLGVPIRPAAESRVEPAGEQSVNRAHQLLLERLPRVRLLTDFEGPAFGTTGDIEADLLSITSVHPMREDAVRSLLARNRADWSVVEGLIARRALVATEYRGERFYVRRLTTTRSTPEPRSS